MQPGEIRRFPVSNHTDYDSTTWISEAPLKRATVPTGLQSLTTTGEGGGQTKIAPLTPQRKIQTHSPNA